MLKALDLIVWDFDGVLNRNYDANGFLWSRALPEDHGISIDAFTERLFPPAYFHDILIGRRDLLVALETLLPDLGCGTPPRDFLDYWFTNDLALDPAVLDIIRRLMIRGTPQAIGTNNEPHRAAFIEAALAAEGLDLPVFASGRLGSAKPQPEFYGHVARAMGAVLPARILLIDDTPKCIAGARGQGWQTFQYGDASDDRLGDPAELTALLDL